MRRLLITTLVLAAGLAGGCGGSRPQSAACADFVACVAARDAARGTTTNVARFVDGGACWTAAEEAAISCDTACSRGLEVLATVPDAPGACR